MVMTAFIVISLQSVRADPVPVLKGEDPEIIRADIPLILSENLDNKVLRFWASPNETINVLYDQWTFYLFGNYSDQYLIKVNGIEIANGSLKGEYANVSWDASLIGQADVLITIGNRSYRFPTIVINHQAFDYNEWLNSEPAGSYTQYDIDMAKLKTGVGVTICAVISIWITKKVVEYKRNKQGVVQL